MAAVPVTVQVRRTIAGTEPQARHVRTSLVARHREDKAAHERIRHALVRVHLADPVGVLRAREENLHVRRPSVPDLARDEYVLGVPVRPEINHADLECVADLRDALEQDESLLEARRLVRLRPLAELLAELVPHPSAAVAERLDDAAEVRRHHDVEQRPLRTTALEPDEQPRVACLLDGTREVRLVEAVGDAGPGLHHGELLRERVEPSVVQAEERVFPHRLRHRRGNRSPPLRPELEEPPRVVGADVPADHALEVRHVAVLERVEPRTLHRPARIIRHTSTLTLKLPLADRTPRTRASRLTRRSPLKTAC